MSEELGGCADVGIHLALRRNANAHGLQVGVVDVGGDDHPALGLLRRRISIGGRFPAWRRVPSFGDDALAGVVAFWDRLV